MIAVTQGVQPFEHYKRLIKGLALRIQRRMYAAGAKTMQLADIEQEIAITWLTARDKYDASKGVPFEPYFTRAVWFNVNRWAQEEIDACNLTPMSLDTVVTEDGDATIHEVIPDPSPRIDEILADRETRERIMSRLSPRTKAFVKLLAEPTPELYREHNALRQRSEYARARGLSSMCPRELGASMLFKLLGYHTLDRSAVYREIEAVTASHHIPLTKRANQK